MEIPCNLTIQICVIASSWSWITAIPMLSECRNQSIRFKSDRITWNAMKSVSLFVVTMLQFRSLLHTLCSRSRSHIHSLANGPMCPCCSIKHASRKQSKLKSCFIEKFVRHTLILYASACAASARCNERKPATRLTTLCNGNFAEANLEKVHKFYVTVVARLVYDGFFFPTPYEHFNIIKQLIWMNSLTNRWTGCACEKNSFKEFFRCVVPCSVTLNRPLYQIVENIGK